MPDLRNEHAPHFRFGRSSFCVGLLLQIKHPLRKRDEVRDEMIQRRGVVVYE